jgi:hypothetical protein
MNLQTIQTPTSTRRGSPALVIVFLLAVSPGIKGENGISPQSRLSIEPAHALPDYTNSIAAGDTDSRRFGNAFAVADFNADGRLDVAVDIHGPDQNNRAFAIRTYLQDSGGAFQQKVEMPVPTISWTWTYSTGDFDKDGYSDVLMDDIGNDLLLVLGKGDGTFREPRTLGLGASGLFAVADLDVDGFLDLVAGNLDRTVGVFLGNGDGTFRAQPSLNSYVIPIAPPAGEILIGDINLDGKLDIAVASVPDNVGIGLGQLDVFLGKGDGTFGEAITTPNIAARRGALADFNGDGVLDFAGDRTSPSQVEIWRGSGDGHFARIVSYALSYSSVWMIKVADLNSDFIPDLLVSGAPLLPSNIFLGKGDGTFQPRISFSPAGNYQLNVSSPEIIDMNLDGLPDIVGLAENVNSQPEEVLTLSLNEGVKYAPTRGAYLVASAFEGGGFDWKSPMVFEVSSNLADWVSFVTNSAPFGPIWRYNDTTILRERFYRIRRLE